MALNVTLMSRLRALLRVTTHSSREGRKGPAAGTCARLMEEFLMPAPGKGLGNGPSSRVGCSREGVVRLLTRLGV